MSHASESESETGETDIKRLSEEFIEELRTKDDPDEPVDLDYLVDHTSAEDVQEAKSAVRVLSDEGWVTTTPGWEYKLAGRRL